MIYSVIALTVMLILMAAKMPVFVAILSGASLYFGLNTGTQNIMAAQRFIAGVESIPLLAIPFFVGMGVFMNKSGVAKRIMNFATACVGGLSGGLAQVNILLSTLMGGISGSNLADAAMQAKILVPEMRKNGYTNEFSSAITAVSSLITPLIPPGIGMIMFASVTNVSIGKLFLSGIGIGLLLCISMMVLTMFISKRRAYKSAREDKISRREFWLSLKGALVPLLFPFVIIGGVRFGWFTAYEAGAVGILLAIVLGFTYKELSLQGFLDGIYESVIASSSILMIIGAASVLSWTLTNERVPQLLTQQIVQIVPNKYVFLLLINLLLLVMGMLIEGNAITIVVAPLIFPIAMAFGIHEIHFAMIFIFNLALGAISPPVGTVMYVTCGITGCSIKDFLAEAKPYFILLGILLLVITYIPAISLFLV